SNRAASLTFRRLGASWRAACRVLPQFATWACLNVEKLKGSRRRIPYPPPFNFSHSYLAFLANLRRPGASWVQSIPVEPRSGRFVTFELDVAVCVAGLGNRGVAHPLP